MPFEAFLTAASVVPHAGKTGLLYDHVGQISVSQASFPGVDENLRSCLKIAVDALRLAINNDASDTGHPEPLSLYRDGPAVSVNRAGAVHKKWHLATLRNPPAVRLVEYLLAHGFQAEQDGRVPSEAGYPAILFGPAGTPWNPSDRSHTPHLHLSLPRKHRPGAVLGEMLTGEGRVGAGASTVE